MNFWPPNPGSTVITRTISTGFSLSTCAGGISLFMWFLVFFRKFFSLFYEMISWLVSFNRSNIRIFVQKLHNSAMSNCSPMGKPLQSGFQVLVPHQASCPLILFVGQVLASFLQTACKLECTWQPSWIHDKECAAQINQVSAYWPFDTSTWNVKPEAPASPSGST